MTNTTTTPPESRQTFGHYASLHDTKRRIFVTDTGVTGVFGRPYTVLGEPYQSYPVGWFIVVKYIDVYPPEVHARPLELCKPNMCTSPEELSKKAIGKKRIVKRLIEELQLR
jgi:hypothetical protein